MSWLEINKFIDFNLGIIILLIKEIKKSLGLIYPRLHIKKKRPNAN